MLPDDAILVGETRLSFSKIVRVSIGTFDSRSFVYVSLFALDRGQGPDQAVDLRRGLTFKPEVWARLLPIITEAISKATERASLEVEEEPSGVERHKRHVRIRGGWEGAGQ